MEAAGFFELPKEARGFGREGALRLPGARIADARGATCARLQAKVCHERDQRRLEPESTACRGVADAETGRCLHRVAPLGGRPRSGGPRLARLNPPRATIRGLRGIVSVPCARPSPCRHVRRMKKKQRVKFRDGFSKRCAESDKGWRGPRGRSGSERAPAHFGFRGDPPISHGSWKAQATPRQPRGEPLVPGRPEEGPGRSTGHRWNRAGPGLV